MLKKVLKPTGNTFGKRLREARVRRGLTQDALGVAIGLDEGPACIRISRYESGVHLPSLEVLWALAKALEIPAAFLVTEDDQLARWILTVQDLDQAEKEQLETVLSHQIADRS